VTPPRIAESWEKRRDRCRLHKGDVADPREPNSGIEPDWGPYKGAVIAMIVRRSWPRVTLPPRRRYQRRRFLEETSELVGVDGP